MFCKNCGNNINEDAIFCNKCGKSIDQNNLSDNQEKIEFFSIPIGRLILFSILTFGIYEIYWFYKNWEAIKKYDNQKISPLGRAIFAVFYCYSLFKKVLESSKNRGYDGKYSPGILATAYILILISGNALSKVDSSDPAFNIVWLVVALFSFVPLIPIQKAINFNNGVKSDPGTRKFSGGEVALIIIGLVWFGLVILGTFSSEDKEITIEQSLIEASNSINKTLPQTVDKVTQLTNTSVSGKELIYSYKLTSTDKLSQSDLDKYLKKDIVNSVCTTAETKNMINLGAGLVYTYYNNVGKYIGKISVHSYDCK